MTDNGSPTPPRRIVFMCQAVDVDDPVLATTVPWLEALARKPGVEHIDALTLREGRHSLPANVVVKPFRRANRLATAAAFYRALLGSLRPRPDLFFIYQGGDYPAMLQPFRLLLRIPVVQWKAHSFISGKMAFYARWFDDLILTSARAAFPMDLAKIRVVGQGIDTNRFCIEERPRLGDLVAVGRIAPTKCIEQMVVAVAVANRSHGTDHRLNVYGPVLPGQEEYTASLHALIGEQGAGEWVTLNGPLTQEQLPALLNSHRASINFTIGAIDKTAVEAMACGLPVVTCNDSIAEVLPADLHPALVCERDDPEAQARLVHELLSRPDEEIAGIGQRLRDLVVSDHSVDRLFDRMLEEIETLLEQRR